MCKLIYIKLLADISLCSRLAICTNEEENKIACILPHVLQYTTYCVQNSMVTGQNKNRQPRDGLAEFFGPRQPQHRLGI